MSDQTTSTGAGPDVVITPAADTPAELSTSQAAAAYLAALAPKRPTAESADESATADPELSDEDNADPENPAPGEDENADPDAETQPLIARPKSWTDAEDAEWQATPRKLQEKIVARELERDTAIRRAQNDAAEKLKGLTAKEQQAEQAKQRYEAQLPALMQSLLDAQQTHFADIKTVDDVQKLAAEDPFRYLQWQAQQTKLQAVNAENEKIKGEKTRAQQTERQTRRNAETERLIEKVPEFADKTKLDAAQKAAAQLFRDVGYSDSELTALSDEPLLDDHRIQLIVNDAMKFRALQKAKAPVAVKLVPPVVRPGTSQPSGARGADRIQALDSKLNNSGDIKDAAALYIAQQNANRRRASS